MKKFGRKKFCARMEHKNSNLNLYVYDLHADVLKFIEKGKKIYIS